MKKEWNHKFNEKFSLSSITNGINPIINILIESVDRFSFGENLDDGKNDILRSLGPDNYLLMNNKIKTEQDNIINSIEEIVDYNGINNNDVENNNDNSNNNNNSNVNQKENEDNKNKDKNKICGLFSKEDFDIKSEQGNNKVLKGILF